jgi:hypothetical protein
MSFLIPVLNWPLLFDIDGCQFQVHRPRSKVKSVRLYSTLRYSTVSYGHLRLYSPPGSFGGRPQGLAAMQWPCRAVVYERRPVAVTQSQFSRLRQATPAYARPPPPHLLYEDGGRGMAVTHGGLRNSGRDAVTGHG